MRFHPIIASSFSEILVLLIASVCCQRNHFVFSVLPLKDVESGSELPRCCVNVGFPDCGGRKRAMENGEWIYSLCLADRHLWGERGNFGFLQNILPSLLH